MKNEHRRIIYVKDNFLTEKEFLSREFNLEIKISNTLVKDCLREISLYGNCLVATPNPFEIVAEISALPEASVIVFLLGNETYEPHLFNCFNIAKSIKWAFIYNLPSQICKMTPIVTFLGDMIDSKFERMFGKESSWRDFLISRSLKNKFKAIDITYPHSRFPQGYSNSFVHQLFHLNIVNSQESIYESKRLLELRDSNNRTIYLNFIGQLTNRRRSDAIKMANKISNTVIRISEGFGGTRYTDNFYVETQLNSLYCLVPPGFFNNQNHRYAESLILGSMPLILSHNSIDPSENLNWTKNINLISGHSFKYLFRYASKILEKQRRQILTSELANERVNVLKVQDQLESLLLRH